MRVNCLLRWVLPSSVVLLVLSGVAGAARARTPRGDAAHCYRDGDRKVCFTRTGDVRAGLERLLLRAGERRWTAWVGREAVVTTRDVRSLRGIEHVRTLRAAQGVHLVRGRHGEDGAALAARLSARGVAAVPNLYRARRASSIAIPPRDPRYGGQWYLDLLAMEDAWRIHVGASTTTVAVIDNGFDFAHPDLAAKFVGQLDVLEGDGDASFAPGTPGNEHGTACAGLIAAATDNGLGIAGACPLCSLAGIRLVGGKTQLVPLSADVEAFEYAFTIGAAVVSNSWGYVEAGPVEQVLAQTIARLTKDGFGGRGALVVFAAGNENRTIEDDELLALPGVLSVNALNRFDEAVPYANQGTSLGLSAPAGTLTTDIAGVDGASPGDYTDVFGGTSSACPLVAGIAGLLRSAAPEARAERVLEVLQRSARRAPFAASAAGERDPVYGYGIVDPVAALRMLVPPADASGPDAGTGGSDASTSASDAGDSAANGDTKQREDASVSDGDAASVPVEDARGRQPGTSDAGRSARETNGSGCAFAGGGLMDRVLAGYGESLLLALIIATRRRRPRVRRA